MSLRKSKGNDVKNEIFTRRKIGNRGTFYAQITMKKAIYREFISAAHQV